MTREEHKRARREGLPYRCECGGLIEYTWDMGRVWSTCRKCTPVVRIDINRLKKKGLIA